ncbi:unnamed protein product, partial [Mesorhabditis belari]|uniref:Uncharacterized protein n=1 Tax=Mesorhabditis belari TaxID=2138241 RepID=A0AAF3EP68_9BILA
MSLKYFLLLLVILFHQVLSNEANEERMRAKRSVARVLTFFTDPAPCQTEKGACVQLMCDQCCKECSPWYCPKSFCMECCA